MEMIGRGTLRRHGFVGNCSASMASWRVRVVCVWRVYVLRCLSVGDDLRTIALSVTCRFTSMRLPVILATVYCRVLYYAKFETRSIPLIFTLA